MIGIESVLANVDDRLIQIHAVTTELVQASYGGEDGGGLIELDNGGLEVSHLEGGVATEAERCHLVETVVTGGCVAVKRPEVGLGHAEKTTAAQLLLVDIKRSVRLVFDMKRYLPDRPEAFCLRVTANVVVMWLKFLQTLVSLSLIKGG